MKSAFSSTRTVPALFAGLLVLLFSASCSKHDHDCAKPSNVPTTTTNGNTRSGEFDTNSKAIGTDTDGGGSVSYRGGVEGDLGNGCGDGGISDDGDSQSDRERSNHKKHGN